jgi:hypothetical protein
VGWKSAPLDVGRSMWNSARRGGACSPPGPSLRNPQRGGNMTGGYGDGGLGEITIDVVVVSFSACLTAARRFIDGRHGSSPGRS